MADEEKKIKEKPAHGTYASYTNTKCRCDLCREAAREYMRKYRTTEQGRKKSRLYAQVAARRNARAAQWLKENNPEVWEQICNDTPTAK